MSPLLMPTSSHAQSQGVGSSYAPESLPAHYDVDRSIIHLENAGLEGFLPRETAAVYAEKVAYAGQLAPHEAFGPAMLHELDEARRSLALLLRCDTDEIALTRSGTDGLERLILGYNRLRPGDAILHCDLDYDTMIAAMDALAARCDASVVRFTMPEPATTANILAAYEDILRQTPQARLLLLTHVSHRTGLVMPVREIVHMARARGVDTVVDAAHGIGCLDVTLPDFDADFVGWSMHKWMGAPLGTGAIYIRRNRIQDIDVPMADPVARPGASGDAIPEQDLGPSDIRARVPLATLHVPSALTIPAAIAFHRNVGPAAKEAQLRSLRNRWVDAARSIPGLEITVPDDPARYCVITSLRLLGMRTVEDSERLQQLLLHRHRILTVVRTGVAAGPVLRVAPALYNYPEECDALVHALHTERTLFG